MERNHLIETIAVILAVIGVVVVGVRCSTDRMVDVEQIRPGELIGEWIGEEGEVISLQANGVANAQRLPYSAAPEIVERYSGDGVWSVQNYGEKDRLCVLLNVGVVEEVLKIQERDGELWLVSRPLVNGPDILFRHQSGE